MKLGGCKYLLGQTVRQFWVPNKNKCVSKAALELWNKLEVGESIFGFWSGRAVVYKNREPVEVEWYNGAHGTPYGKNPIFVGDKWGRFHFRSAFHVEHIIPINSILDKLMKLDLSQDKEIIYSEIDEILKGIYECFMLKKEDRALNQIGAKTKRPNKVEDVINQTYRKAGIEIAEWGA